MGFSEELGEIFDIDINVVKSGKMMKLASTIDFFR